MRGNGGKVVVARPSFPLYESHCRYDGIPFDLWHLNQDLDYDVNTLPPLPDGSLVVFASPNNPVGNVLPRSTFASLLKSHPKTLFLADEAYFEYAAEPYTELLTSHSNLLLLRTFSKTMGAAGVRLGYFMGSSHYLDLLKKLRLPYLLNHFSIACADVLLTDPDMQAHLAKIKSNAVAQRHFVYERLAGFGRQHDFFVKKSEANFLLLRWPKQEAAVAAYRNLVNSGILVRNVSGAPGLTGCLRITLGNEQENEALLQAFKTLS